MDLFLSLNGRIGRGKFWLGLLGIMIGSMIIGAILGVFGVFSIDPVTGQPGSGFWIGYILLMAALIWPSICVYGKRYHDRDKSAWWMLVGIIPIIGTIWVLVECGLLEGTEGPNRYGEDPIAR
ncbi:MAG: DUF805 domain-containing protein [Anderseniella sp.]